MTESPRATPDPCPFCTSSARTVAGWQCWYVRCDSCDTDGPSRDTEAESIAAWNRRATSDQGSAELREHAAFAAWNSMPSEARASLRHFLSSAIVFGGPFGRGPGVHDRTLDAFDEWFALIDSCPPSPAPSAEPQGTAIALSKALAALRRDHCAHWTEQENHDTHLAEMMLRQLGTGFLATATRPAPTHAQADIAHRWREAYAAFKGAFDTPQMRRHMGDEYSKDARKRLRDFDEAFVTAGDAGKTGESAASSAMGDDGTTKAARDVLAERARQISVEGWTPEHDDEHEGGQMASAAAAYAIEASDQVGGMMPAAPNEIPPSYWPWDEKWWKPRDARSNLIRAAALLIAEIERLDRAASPSPSNESEDK